MNKINYTRVLDTHPKNVEYILQQSNEVVEFKNIAKKMKKEDEKFSLMQYQNILAKSYGFLSVKNFYDSVAKKISLHLQKSPLKMKIEKKETNISSKELQVGKDCYGLYNSISLYDLSKHMEIKNNDIQEKNIVEEIIKNGLNLFVVDSGIINKEIYSDDKLSNYQIITISPKSNNVIQTQFESDYVNQLSKILNIEAKDLIIQVKLSKNKPTRIIDFFNEKVLVLWENTTEDIEQYLYPLFKYISEKKSNKEYHERNFDFYLFKNLTIPYLPIFWQGRAFKMNCIWIENSKNIGSMLNYDTEYNIYGRWLEVQIEEIKKQKYIAYHHKHNTILKESRNIISLTI